ncbi:hypothetical protein ACHAXS_002344, partial [Conticribra weissflogii]
MDGNSKDIFFVFYLTYVLRKDPLSLEGLIVYGSIDPITNLNVEES